MPKIKDPPDECKFDVYLFYLEKASNFHFLSQVIFKRAPRFKSLGESTMREHK